LQELIAKTGLELLPSEKLGREDVQSKEVEVIEAIVKPGSVLSGKTPASARLRSTYQVNLLGIARHGHRARARLKNVRFQVGDVLLLQGARQDLDRALAELGGIPLAGRTLGLGKPRRLIVALAVFVAAIGAVLVGVLPAHLAFVSAVALLVTLRALPIDEVYNSVDWPVIVLLGAMLPVGDALESTGGTDLVAQAILDASGGLSPLWVLALLLVSTMMLSDVINNNATAVLMAPIALTLAERLGASPDPFLMAVAIGASCAFLTPIGHQANTLVLGPGGYEFSDYWRVGLPLEIVIAAVAVPLLPIVWPF
jgi:di/tricarboxylate transporter